MPRYRFMRNRAVPGLLLLWAAGCTRTLPIRVELEDAQAPSPRSDGFRRNVRALRLKALIGGRLVTLPDSPADQGEINFADTLDPSVERIVVEGLDEAGQVFSSGASAPLDLFLAPPEDGVVSIFFSRVAELSFTGEGTEARPGARAHTLSDGRVAFLGGRGNDGCTPETSSIYSVESEPRFTAGPILPGGRVGFDLVPLPNGEVVVAGGTQGCGTSTTTESPVFAWLRFDPLGSDTRTPLGPALPKERVAAAVTDREVVLAGGRSGALATAEVLGFRFDDAGSTLRTIGLLGQPRARASAVPIDGRRILLAGGTANLISGRPLASGTVYVPQSGQVVTATVPLLEGVDHPGLGVHPGGVVWAAGGRLADGTGSNVVQSIAIRRETDASFSDVSRVAQLPRGMERPTVLGCGAAGALIVPDDQGDLAFVDAMGGVTPVVRPAGVTGRLVGGRLADGTVVLLDEAGQVMRFNPGPFSTLGPAAGPEGLSLAGQGPTGLLPLRPDRWQRDEEGFSNVQPIVNGSLLVQELVLAGDRRYGDFDLSFEYLPIGQARVALVFGYGPNRYAYLALAGFTSLEQFGAGVAPSCTQPSAGLLEPRPHVVRIQRRALRLTLEVDGISAIPCDLPPTSIAAGAGSVGFGVISGQIQVRRVALGD